MKGKTLLAIAGLYLLYRHFSRPKWVDDLLIRTYGPDHLEDGRKDPKAAAVASEYGLPVKWVMELRQKGVTDENLSFYADKVIAKVLSLGPPPNAQPNTLAAYKAAVLDVTP